MVTLMWPKRKDQERQTFNVVGPVAELQAEYVINGPAGVQRVGCPVVADEAVLPPQDQHGPVDEFQSEPFVLPWWMEGG